MRQKTLNSRQLLHGVSRSFGLSIRLLPQALREPVGLAYLLARASDTVADTPALPAAHRLALLDTLAHAITAPASQVQLSLVLRDFARHVPDQNEKNLLTKVQDCLNTLSLLPDGDQTVIRQVLEAIIEGQRWDLKKLDAPECGVQTRAEVDRYTWQVAGSVGEFWTRICQLHLKHWHTSSHAELMQWGAHYGKGLQRLNILRDAHRDLLTGRCYFPNEELKALGLDRHTLCTAVREGDRATLQRMTPLLDEWQRITQALLHDGLRYSLALRGRRLRLASALPCLIGIRTLGLLRQTGSQALLSHLKLPRREVHQLLWRLVLSGVSDCQLKDSWDQALPAPLASPL